MRNFEEICLDNLIYLEKILGSIVSFNLMEPFTIKTDSLESINQAAAKIAGHLGMTGIVFKVVYDDLKDASHTGNIILKPGQRIVDIKLSHKTKPFEKAVLGILAHEITHKYLHAHLVYKEAASSLNSEYLTDIACIYLGLGKLLINGSIAHSKDVFGRPLDIKFGYLNTVEMIFTYKLVCMMRHIDESHYINHISNDIKEVFTNSIMTSDRYFNKEFHNRRFLEEKTYNLKTELKLVEGLHMELNDLREELEKVCFRNIDKMITDMHDSLILMESKVATLHNSSTYNPCEIYLETLNKSSECDEYMKLLNEYHESVEQVHERLAKLIDSIQNERGGSLF